MAAAAIATSTSADDEPCVVRFANLQEGSVIFDDQIADLSSSATANWTI